MTQPILHVQPGALDHVPAGIVLALVKRWGLVLDHTDGQMTLKRDDARHVPPLTPHERGYLWDAINSGPL